MKRPPSTQERLAPGSGFAVPLQTVGLLATLIFLANGTFEVLVVNDLNREQYGLIAGLVGLLSVWALGEVVLLHRRSPSIPLLPLQLALALQLGVVLLRHAIGVLRTPAIMDGFGTANRPQFGMAISFMPLYLAIFLAINKLIIDVFVHLEQRRANQLEAQMEALETARRDLREARDAAEEANVALRASNARLHGQASSDPLTGLANRRHFEAALVDQLALSQRVAEPLSLLMLDVDHFKRINDGFGHRCGDLVLVELARLLRSRLRKPDLLARWGGDEFIVMLPHTPGDSALQLARQICATVAVHVFPAVPAVTASIGVAEWQPGESLDQWFARADQVLYAVKASGRNGARLSA